MPTPVIQLVVNSRFPVNGTTSRGIERCCGPSFSKSSLLGRSSDEKVAGPASVTGLISVGMACLANGEVDEILRCRRIGSSEDVLEAETK